MELCGQDLRKNGLEAELGEIYTWRRERDSAKKKIDDLNIYSYIEITDRCVVIEHDVLFILLTRMIG